VKIEEGKREEKIMGASKSSCVDFLSIMELFILETRKKREEDFSISRSSQCS
jgi:hypothetical protein